MEHLFSPNSSGDLRSDARQSQTIMGDADVDHTQIIGEDISPPSPPGFGTLVNAQYFSIFAIIRLLCKLF